MYAVFKKVFLASILVLVALTTGAWQSNKIVLAESQNTNIPEMPLYPGLSWSSLGLASRDITINVNGNAISVSGEAYKAAEQFAAGVISQDVLNYYSNEQLAKSGWASYDASQKSDGTHYIFYHESGVYLSVEFLKCPRDTSSVCLTVWKSTQTKPTTISPEQAAGPSSLATATGSFGKTSPANGTTNLDPASITLSWGTYSPTPDKYSYCVKEGSACDASDPNWTSTYTNTSVTLTGLSYDKTYYWQVKAITCVSCVPKTVVYADNGTVWTFKTKQNAQAVILGNAGVAGATLSYTDGTLKTVTADGTGAYSITVPLNWSGTVTPAKPGYLFYPKNASFSNLTAAQTIQNFTAVIAFTISGNVGVSGVTLSYTDVTPQTVMSDSSGNYSIMVPQGWSGTVTPSKTNYTFSPVSKTYPNVTANQIAQNYNALVNISGNVGVGGAVLRYTDGTLKTVTADGSGNYSITVPLGWSGTVTPYKSGYTFTPVSKTYGNVQSSLTGQDYVATACVSCADIQSWIGGGQVGAYTLGASQSGVDTYPLSNGPVEVKSTNSVPVIAAERVIFAVNGTSTSYSELMGLPKTQLATSYLFPWYNNLQLNSQLRFGNVGSASTIVSIKIHGTTQATTYTLAPGESQVASFGVSDGPVEVFSDGQNIIAAERVIFAVNNTATSYSELMGLPKTQATTSYLFPWYNNQQLNSQLRFGNVGSASTIVSVKIHGVTQATTYTLAPGESQVASFGVSDGPVEVFSDGQNIIAAERVIFAVNNTSTSYSELMGLPKTQATTSYLFPWYNNQQLNSQLRFGNVGSASTIVSVKIHGVTQATTYTLAPGESMTATFPASDGPVEVFSDGQNIIAAERVIFAVNGTSTSYSELMGLPQTQLATSYLFPWYNNLQLNAQLRFAAP